MYLLMESIAFIHHSERQARLLSMEFTKEIPSLANAAQSIKQENGEEQDACAHIEESI